MKNNLLRFFLFCSVLFCSQFLSAQCTEQHNDNMSVGSYFLGSGDRYGQTFIACETGNITSISFDLSSFQQAGSNHEFRLGSSSTPPTACIAGPALETFSTTAGTQTVTITLSSPFSVISGQTYAFEYSRGTVALVTSQFANNTYTDGNRYFSSSCPTISENQPGVDLNFTVCINGCPTSGSPAGIPTLSEWGLLILALLLMTLGTVYLLQPQWREGLNKNS